ncbi:sugar ABC transporter substrate-binding protein [Kineococcus sp. NUM-3379]
MIGTRLGAALAGLVVPVLLLTSCGGPAGEGEERRGTVGIAMPTRTSERWVADGANMVEQFEAAGYATDLRYAEDDIPAQLEQVGAMVERGVEVLVVAAIDGRRLAPVLERAQEAGIPVISYDRLILDSPNVDYYATFDNLQVGRLQGAHIRDALDLDTAPGPFELEVFGGSPDDNNAYFFFRGAMEVLQPHLDSGRLRVRSGEVTMEECSTLRWSGRTAGERMARLLAEHHARPGEEVDAVLSPYDGISRGVLEALREAGYGTPGRPLPVVTGQDAELESVRSIVAGEQAQTVYKDTRELARVAVRMATATLEGRRPPLNDERTYDNGVKVVPSYLLPPVSVDRSNYRQVLVEGGYYTAEQVGG